MVLTFFPKKGHKKNNSPTPKRNPQKVVQEIFAILVFSDKVQDWQTARDLTSINWTLGPVWKNLNRWITSRVKQDSKNLVSIRVYSKLYGLPKSEIKKKFETQEKMEKIQNFLNKKIL